MNQARDQATATLLPNGKVLIAGGNDLNGNELSSVELYDPASNSFAPAASTPTMNHARSAATATLLFSGKVLIAGGGAGEGGFFTSLKSVELYDPASNSFAPAAALPTMNTARDSAAAALLPNGEVLIAGGEGGPFPIGGPLNSVELYNPVTNNFAPAVSTPTMNDFRAFATATSLANGKVLIAGGLEGFIINVPEISNSVDLYNPATNSFAASTPVMNAARFDATAALLANGNALIAGGIGPGPPGPFMVTLNAVDLYDPATNTFAPAASLPTMNTSRQSATATLLNNGKVLIAGGENNSNQVLASVDLYDGASNSFVPAASLPTMNQARFNATATLLPSGKVLIAGGQELPPKTLSSTELYTP
jgi:N-acetylneuraminic acid mutarotase